MSDPCPLIGFALIATLLGGILSATNLGLAITVRNWMRGAVDRESYTAAGTELNVGLLYAGSTFAFAFGLGFAINDAVTRLMGLGVTLPDEAITTFGCVALLVGLSALKVLLFRAFMGCRFPTAAALAAVWSAIELLELLATIGLGFLAHAV
jgi:hypothetical protein